MLLAPEYKNPTFDYHNQLMYEREQPCTAARRGDCLCLLLQSSTLVAYTSHRIFSRGRRAPKRPLEAQLTAVHLKGKSPTYMPPRATARRGCVLTTGNQKVCVRSRVRKRKESIWPRRKGTSSTSFHYFLPRNSRKHMQIDKDTAKLSIKYLLDIARKQSQPVRKMYCK